MTNKLNVSLEWNWTKAFLFFYFFKYRYILLIGTEKRLYSPESYLLFKAKEMFEPCRLSVEEKKIEFLIQCTANLTCVFLFTMVNGRDVGVTDWRC